MSAEGKISGKLSYVLLAREAAGEIERDIEDHTWTPEAAQQLRTLASGLRQLAVLVERVEQVDWSEAKGWREELLSQLAAGFSTSRAKANEL